MKVVWVLTKHATTESVGRIIEAGTLQECLDAFADTTGMMVVSDTLNELTGSGCYSDDDRIYKLRSK